MKNYKKIIGLILVFFSLSASQINAEGKWWEKGLDFFKNRILIHHQQNPVSVKLATHLRTLFVSVPKM